MPPGLGYSRIKFSCESKREEEGSAYASLLGEGETYTTLELKINFLKPVWRGRLVATAKVVKKGQTIGLVECDITDTQQQLVARASAVPT